MSTTCFGVSNKKLSEQHQNIRRRVAELHGVDWHYTVLRGEGVRSWFAAPNRGEPFDSSLAREVMRTLHVAVGSMPLKTPVRALYVSVAELVGDESSELCGFVALNPDLSSSELARRWRDRGKP